MVAHLPTHHIGYDEFKEYMTILSLQSEAVWQLTIHMSLFTLLMHNRDLVTVEFLHIKGIGGSDISFFEFLSGILLEFILNISSPIVFELAGFWFTLIRAQHLIAT